MIPPRFGKQEVGIWRVKKGFPRYGGTYIKLVTNYQISAINSCWEKCAYMFNVNKNQPSQQTGSRNLTGPKPQYGIPIWRLWPKIRFLPSTVTEKNVTKNILDGRKDGQMDRGKTVYPSPPSGSRGMKNSIPPSLFREQGYNYTFQLMITYP